MKKERCMTSPVMLFEQECQANIAKISGDEKVQKLSREWICESARSHYQTKNHNMLILLIRKQKRFAKLFYCKTALQAVSSPFQQNGLKNCPVVWCKI